MLWEILVPQNFPLEHHKEWDDKVKAISGGLTLLKSVKGQWIAPDGNKINERMIPVRIICNENQIDTILEITRLHYGQQEVLAYRISDLVKRCTGSN